MASGGNGTTATGNLKWAQLATACQWVLDAWDEIKPETICKSFLKCSISNALDGSQDNLLYESESENSSEQDIEVEEEVEGSDVEDGDEMSEEGNVDF